MSLSRYILVSSPAILPLIAVSSALTGLASQLGTFPNVDNLVFVTVAIFLSGIVPACVIAGIVLLLIDRSAPSYRSLLLVASAVVVCAMVVGSYFYGRGLDF